MKQKTEKHDEITLKIIKQELHYDLCRNSFSNYLKRTAIKDVDSIQELIPLDKIAQCFSTSNWKIFPEYALNYGYSIDLLVKLEVYFGTRFESSLKAFFPKNWLRLIGMGRYSFIYEIKPIDSIKSISQVIRQVNQYGKLLENKERPCFKIVISDGDCKPEWKVLLEIARIEFYNINNIEI